MSEIQATVLPALESDDAADHSRSDGTGYGRHRISARCEPRAGDLPVAFGAHRRALPGRRRHRYAGRLIADQLGRKWGQSAIVENIGGAAGNIGAAEVLRAAPDGYTLLLASPGPIATNSFLYKDMPYDPARWTPIALLATGPYVLVLRKSFDGSTDQRPDRARQGQSGKITAATPGIGSVGHLATVQLEMLADIKTVHVPYRGSAPPSTISSPAMST